MSSPAGFVPLTRAQSDAVAAWELAQRWAGRTRRAADRALGRYRAGRGSLSSWARLEVRALRVQGECDRVEVAYRRALEGRR